MSELLLQDFLTTTTRKFPNKIALVYGGERLTYQDLDLQSNTLAHHMIEQGVLQGDRVLLFTENKVDAAISFWAVLKASAVASIINPQTKPEKLIYYLNNSGAKMLVTGKRLLHTIAPPLAQCISLSTIIVASDNEIDREITAHLGLCKLTLYNDCLSGLIHSEPPKCLITDHDLAAIIYTSGSSGSPKGVTLSHRNMISALRSITSYLSNTVNDVILSALPLSFDYGLYQMLMAFQVGACLILERSFTILPKILTRIKIEGVTGFPCVPTVAALLGELPASMHTTIATLRYITSTGAELSEKHIQTLQRFFPSANIYSMYGLTECKRCTYLPPEDLDRKPKSVGIPIPGTEMWLVNEDDHLVKTGEIGQLVIRGNHVMLGYWENPEATNKRLKPGPMPGETVLYTGDLCRMDEEGYLYFVSRMDDIIKSRGEKISPLEIERTLLKIQGVKEVAVIGIKDKIQGAAIVAFVILEDNLVLSEKSLKTKCLSLFEPSHTPQKFRILNKLPVNSHGKVDKNALSKLAVIH